MSGIIKMTVDEDTLTISPRYGYLIPVGGDITHRRTLGGVLYTYIWNTFNSYDMPLNNISYAYAVFLEAWRVAGTDITLVPDHDVAPDTSETVRIVDKLNPMRMMPTGGFNTTAVYEGLLSLEKTTAN